MVYDTDQNQFYYHDGTTWRKMLNSTYWNQSSTRSWIYNSTDSVGIGTSVPTQRLDVNGNIRSRDDLLADGKITAGGIVSGSSFQTPGNLVVSGLGYVNGNLTTNSDFTINNSAAIMQLKGAGSVDKGFVQLAGDDLRLGTNSGNNLGNVFVRMNGANRFQFAESGRFTLLADATPTMYFNTGGINKAYIQLQGDNLRLDAPANKLYLGDDMVVDDATNRVGIGTVSPTEKLQVQGNVLVTGNATINGGRITGTETGAANNMLPLAYGKINFSGDKISGTANFTSANRVGVGDYNLFINGANSNSVLMLSANRVIVFRVFYQGANWYKVWAWDPILDEYANCDFQFVMYSP
jgi:phage baseplate assembly protein gpV